ncbi:hypothetical protein B0H14DRAFT_3857924 [Mycena olivaceomarginata]|nr:hypothetical protein B0H14DRAFT_3857924 [Mycena olivaceomarginata]
MEDPSGTTHGAQWSTAVADYLDDIYARDAAEKAEAAEKLRLKEERQAQRRRNCRGGMALRGLHSPIKTPKRRAITMNHGGTAMTRITIPLWDERAKFARELGGNCDGGIEIPMTSIPARPSAGDSTLLLRRTLSPSPKQKFSLPPLSLPTVPILSIRDRGFGQSMPKLRHHVQLPGRLHLRQLSHRRAAHLPALLPIRAQHQKHRPPELEVRRQSRIRGGNLEVHELRYDEIGGELGVQQGRCRGEALL